jgi:2-phospho-L-lactate/phosphoenolpyruvate guanylyltransferase
VEPTARADLSRTWALVPIRGLETAKTRLGEDLDAEERLELVTGLLTRTLAAARDAARIAGTVVVTMDPAAAGLARDHRAIGLVERAPGLNQAILAARSVAAARGARAVVVVPADLPAISSIAIDSLVESAALAAGGGDGAGSGVVALVPDRHGTGTNALLVSPPALVDPSFGADSFARHRAAAEAAGAIIVELDGPLSLDLDTGADLLAAEAELGTFHG